MARSSGKRHREQERKTKRSRLAQLFCELLCRARLSQRDRDGNCFEEPHNQGHWS